MKFTVCGDITPLRRIPVGYEGFDEVRDYICKGDFKFCNLETTVHRGEHFASQFSGGSYLRSDPEALEDIKEYGFNVLTAANNHSMDFSYGGLISTKKAVEAMGFAHSGIGLNLDEAAAPCYVTTKNGRAALISATSTMGSTEAAIAGKQSRRYVGRPGVNGLRFDEHIEVTADLFEAVREISEKSNINAQRNIERREGYWTSPADDAIELGKLQFKLGDKTKYVTHPNKCDMDRVIKSIKEAEYQADYILVSIHSHEISGDSKEQPAEFLVEFAHRCIDEGADAVIGHGPHLLRPIEIYKGKPIFYSLGDFIIHNECLEYAPEDMYQQKELTSDETMREFYRLRSKDFTRGLMRDNKMLESVIPLFEFEGDKLVKLELMPIELNFNPEKHYKSGDPRFSKNHGIIERLRDMSAPYGTKITIDYRGYGIVEF